MSKNYVVEVKTGNRKLAGTDADVYVQMFGERATSREIELDNPENNFEKNKLDTFTVPSADVGWIDKLRLFHNNHGGCPGWFVDYLKVTDPSAGLSWKVDLYRWLAKDEADHKIDLTLDVPIGGVRLDEGYLRTIYLGYIRWVFSNTGPSDTTAHASIAYSYKVGVSSNTTTARSESTNAQLGGSFFGINAQFSRTMTSSISTSLGTSEETTSSMNVTLDYAVPKGKSITVAFLVYQTVLDGLAHAGGVKLDYENKFIISYDPYVFDGILSDAQIQNRIRAMLAASMGVSLPQTLPQSNAHIKMAETKLATTTKTSVKAAQSSLPTRLILDRELNKYKDVRYVNPKARVQIKPITPAPVIHP